MIVESVPLEVDTSESISIYCITHRKDNGMDEQAHVVKNIGMKLEELGSKTLCVAISDVDTDKGPMVEVNIVFVSHQVDFKVIKDVEEIVSNVFGEPDNLIVTSDIKQTERMMQNKYGWV